MKFQIFWNLLACVALGYSYSTGSNTKAEVTYVGAVIEFEPYNTWTDEEKGYGVIRQNALLIQDYAVQAKSQFADIMVTPEAGLQSMNSFPDEVDKFLTFTQYIPNPADNIIPYSMNINNSNFEGIQILSRAAMENSIYLVIGLAELYPCTSETVLEAPWPIEPDVNCPSTGYFFYNSQVVFDRTGKVIARYRKQHLYGEHVFTPGPKDDTTALFLTDFNVLFTLQICFDIVFEHPAYSNIQSLGVKDVAMGTSWVDYLPFNLADTTQNGWSRGLGVNLLVSGFHNPDNGKLGSGIFKWYSQEPAVYTYNKESGNMLLVSEVTTITASRVVPLSKSKKQDPVLRNLNNELTHQSNIRDNSAKRVHLMVHQNLANFTKIVLESGLPGVSRSTSICSLDQFCCDLTYEYSGNLTYMFIAYSGKFSPGVDYEVSFQTCAVIWCKSEAINTCALVEAGLPIDDSFGPFTIFSSSFAIDTVFPMSNYRDLTLMSKDDLQFDVSGKNFTLKASQPLANTLVASLYGRWYSNDDPHT